MSIRVKFILIFLAITGAIVASSFWNFRLAQQSSDDFGQIVNQTAPAVIALEEIEAGALRIQVEAIGFVLFIAADEEDTEEGEEEIEELTEAYEEFEQWLLEYHTLAQGIDKEIFFAQLVQQGERNFQLSLDLIAVAEQGFDDKKLLQIKDDLEEVEEALFGTLEQATRAEVAQMERERLEAEQSERNALFVFIGSIIGSLLLVSLLGYFVGNTVVTPLVQLKDTALAIGRGDLDRKIKLNSNDEIGELATVFNQMGDELSQARSNLEEKVNQRTAELRQANQALHQTFQKVEESEQLLRSIIDTNPSLIFVKDKTFRYTLVNKPFARLVGLTPPEVVGKDDIELGFPHDIVFGNPEKDILGFRVEDTAVLTGESQHSPQDVVTNIGAEIRIFDTYKIPLRNGEGEIFGVLGLAHDITKLKQTEAELRQSNLRFSNMTQNVPGMIYQFLTQPDGSASMPYVSPASKDILGLEPEAIQNDVNLFFTMPHPDDVSSFQKTGRLSADTLKIWEWVGRTIVNGQIKWIEGFAKPEQQEDGSILWDGLLMDVTERKQLEEELQAYRLDLEARVADRTDRLLLINRISQELNNLLDLNRLLTTFVSLLQDSLALDYAQIYLIEPNSGDLCLIEGTGQVGQQLKQAGHRLKANQGIVGSVARNNEPFLSPYVRQDPLFHPNVLLPNIQSELAVPLRARNEVIGVLDVQSETPDNFATEDVATLQTIADQAAIAVENAQFLAERQATIAKLKDADEAKSQFITMISHELRTPLNAINGFAELLLLGLGGDLSIEAKEDIQLIYNNGQHLSELIKDIIDLTQIESGEIAVKSASLSVRETAEKILSDTRSLVLDKPIEMINQVDENLPTVWADPTRLRQILFNLVSNAIKFTHEGHITISASLHPENSRFIELKVTDTGEGIPAEKMEQIFELFEQADMSDSRQYGGLGIGLTACKMLVDLHHGDIGVKSEVGGGSEFWFTLPIENTNKAK